MTNSPPDQHACVNCGAPITSDKYGDHCHACWQVLHPETRAYGHWVSRLGFSSMSVLAGANTKTSKSSATRKRRTAARNFDNLTRALAAAKYFEDNERERRRRFMAKIRLRKLKAHHKAMKLGKVRGYMDFSEHDQKTKGGDEARNDH